MARRQQDDTGETAPERVVYYAPDGGEYPVDEKTLTATERVNLRAWGYSTEKPSAEEAEAARVEVSGGGPLSGSVEA